MMTVKWRREPVAGAPIAAVQAWRTCRAHSKIRWRDPREAELNEYRAVSASAILGLILALVSSAAFAHPVLWCLPVAAVIVNLLALARIASQAPRLLGRSVALLGLSLSLAIGAAARTHYVASNLRTRYEAQHVVRAWLDDVRQHKFEAAVELMLEPYPASGADRRSVPFYRDEPRALAAVRELAEAAAGQRDRLTRNGQSGPLLGYAGLSIDAAQGTGGVPVGRHLQGRREAEDNSRPGLGQARFAGTTWPGFVVDHKGRYGDQIARLAATVGNGTSGPYPARRPRAVSRNSIRLESSTCVRLVPQVGSDRWPGTLDELIPALSAVVSLRSDTVS